MSSDSEFSVAAVQTCLCLLSACVYCFFFSTSVLHESQSEFLPAFFGPLLLCVNNPRCAADPSCQRSPAELQEAAAGSGPRPGAGEKSAAGPSSLHLRSSPLLLLPQPALLSSPSPASGSSGPARAASERGGPAAWTRSRGVREARFDWASPTLPSFPVRPSAPRGGGEEGERRETLPSSPWQPGGLRLTSAAFAVAR